VHLAAWGSFLTAVGIGIFLFGAATVHLHEMPLEQDYSATNARLTLYTNILAPVMILGLLTLRDRHGLIPSGSSGNLANQIKNRVK
jgi:hypothetical protein